MLLPGDQILALYQAVVEADVDRNSLLARIDARFVATLPTGMSRGGQILRDLSALNAVEALDDGTIPLEIWIENATILAGLRPEARVFKAALHHLRGRGAGPGARRARDRPAGAGSILDDAPYPFGNPRAVELRDLLVSAYPRVDAVEHLARTVPIHLGRWARGGGIEHAWNSLLDQAASQRLVGALVERVLSDAGVYAFHDRIRGCITPEPRR